MSIPFSPRALLCTGLVMAGFAAAVLAELPIGFPGFQGFDREGMLPIGRGGPPPADTRHDIIYAVLAHEARRPNRQNVCLRLSPEGTAFESEKQRIATLTRRLAERPAERARFVAELDRLRNPVRPWQQATDPRFGQPSTPLEAEGAQQLRMAETAVLDGPQAGPVEIVLDMRQVPLGFQVGGGDCNALLFTAPAVIGDLAFVETRYGERQGAPELSLYALARRDGRWEVEAHSR